MSDLTRTFDTSRKLPSGETLEQLRQNYFIEAIMRDSDDSSIGGLRINQSGRKDAAFLARKKEQQATDDALMLAVLESQLAAIENAMIEKYGKDFADNLAAEYLDEDSYKKLMKIEDPEERRKAIAKAINDGIKNGTIDADDVYKNPDFKDWLQTHEKLAQQQYTAETRLAADESSTLDAGHSSNRDQNAALAKGLDAAFS